MRLSTYSLIFLILSAIFYVFFQSSSIYGGDAGDLVSAAYTLGVAHPPGYPLYTVIGHLLTKIPVGSIAWRVGLVSSMSTTATLVLLYLLSLELTKNRTASAIASLTLGTTYLYWLYASVPEVFPLNTLFSIILLYLLYEWNRSKDSKLIFLFFFVFGLSLSHHHIILFMTPAFFYLIFIKRSALLKMGYSGFGKCLLFFLLGLTPYVYIFLSARQIPPIVWNDPDNLQNFLKLITRSQYGTFRSGVVYGFSITSRLLQLPISLEFIKNDFSPVGIFLAILGLFRQFFRNRQIFIYIFLAFIFSGPFYFFYASYQLLGEFNLAILERFLHPSYLFISIWIAEGICALSIYLIFFLSKSKIMPKVRINLYSNLLVLTFFVIPLSLLYINYPKISILKDDRTAENLGMDLLKTPESNSILILERDTPLFDAQYVYYALGYRRDIKLFHRGKLQVGEGIEQIKKYTPELLIPSNRDSKFISNFIKLNLDKYPIYSNIPIPTDIPESFWVTHGLLYKLTIKDELPSNEEIYRKNEELWSTYHDPLSGSLGKYKNLMLFNVVENYREARFKAGLTAETVKRFDSALKHYTETHRLIPDRADSYVSLAVIARKKGECIKSIELFKKALEIEPKAINIFLDISDVYLKCLNDEYYAKNYKKIYEKQKKETETPLRKLL